MGLVTTEIMCTTPVAIFSIVLNATATEIGPWRSWENTHFDYSRVEQFPAVLWRSNRLLVVGMELTRWLAPACAIIFFLFFGFAEEARKNYRAAIAFILRRGKTPVTAKGLKALRITPTSSSSYDMKSQSPVTGSLKSHLSQSTLIPPFSLSKVDSSYLNKPIAHRQSDIPETAPAYSVTFATHLSSDDLTISTPTSYGDTHSLSSYFIPPILPVSNLEPMGLSPPPRCPIIKPPFPRDLPSFADSTIMDSPSRLQKPQTVPEDVVESPPGRETLNLPGGILITVQTQASVDNMV
jgi:Pheromone A receptor